MRESVIIFLIVSSLASCGKSEFSTKDRYGKEFPVTQGASVGRDYTQLGPVIAGEKKSLGVQGCVDKLITLAKGRGATGIIQLQWSENSKNKMISCSGMATK